MKTLRVIGVVAIICAGLGFMYNFSGRYTILSGERPPFVEKEPYFWPAFCIMTAICLACYLALALFGIQLLRGRIGWVTGFICLLVFEVVYDIGIGFLWTEPHIGYSVAGATGVATGGLMFQYIILFPLWAGILAYRAKRRLEARIYPSTGGNAAPPRASV